MTKSKYQVKHLLTIFLIFILFFAFGGCSKDTSSPESISTSSQSVRDDNPLKNIKSWAYLIENQHLDGTIQKLADSTYDMLVIDQTRSVKEDEQYNSKSDVSILQSSYNSQNQNKIVLSYLNIGEAESYRWYWNDQWKIGNPGWIVAKDPDNWDENYPVLFWDEEWKNIVQQSIKRIVDDGYNGVYLDWLEIYSFEPVQKAAKSQGLDSRTELTYFIKELVEYAHALNPNFIFIAQNASELGEYSDYITLFDGIAQEAIWFDGEGDPDSGNTPGDVKQDIEESNEYITNLQAWQRAEKPVFHVEYAEIPSNVDYSYEEGKKFHFITYVTLCPLDKLTSPPSGD